MIKKCLSILLLGLVTLNLSAQNLNVKKENPYEIYVDPSMLDTYLGQLGEVNEGKQFSFGARLLSQSYDVMEGEWCITIWKDGDLVKSYPAFSEPLKRGSLYCLCYAGWLDIPAGDYQVRPLYKKEGDDFWTMPDPNVSLQRAWNYTFHPENTIQAPSCSYFYPKENKYPGKMVWASTTMSTNFFTVPSAGEPLVMEYHIRNKQASDLKGELLAYYERDLDSYAPFDDYYMEGKNPENQWSDLVGTQELSIKAGEAMIGYITVRGTQHTLSRSFAPQLRLYFRPEGSSEKILVRDDCDSLFDTDHQVKKELLEHTPERFIDGMLGTFNFVMMNVPFLGPTATEAVVQVSYQYKVSEKMIYLIGLDEKSSISIVNMNGKVVLSREAEADMVVNMVDYPSGVYILTVEGKRYAQSVKVMIR